MRKIYTVLFFIAHLPLFGQNRLHIDHLTLEDGLSQNNVRAIVQDKKGFMWFGTHDGLNRFDGYKFTVFKYNPYNTKSFPEGFITGLCEDKEGYLWIAADGLCRFNTATYDAEIFRFDPKNEHSLSNDKINCLHYNTHGQLWIGTYNGLSLYLPQTKSFKRFLYDSTFFRTRQNIIVNTILTDTEGVLWLGTNKGLGHLNKETGVLTKITLIPNNKSEESINYLYQDKNKTIWVGTATTGLFEMLPNKQLFKSYTFNPNNTSSISNNTINGILEDRNNQFWITTANGVNILNRKTGECQRFYSIPEDKNSLTTNERTQVFEDKEGVLWFAGRKSLERYNPRRKLIELYRPTPDKGNGLNDSDPWPIVDDEKGNIWIGTLGGGINVLDRKTGKFTYYMHNPSNPNSLSENAIFHMIFDEKGRLWMKTVSNGITCFDKNTGKFTHYTHDPKNMYSLSADGGCSAICQDSVGRFWFGTGNGLNYFDEKTGRFTHYLPNPNDSTSISSHSICYIYKDSHNDVWVGTWGKGLNRWNRKTNTFTQFLPNPNDPNSIINKSIYCIVEDKNGNIWTGGHVGMSRYNPKTNQFQNYTVQSGLPNNVVYGIIPDDKNRLWISTNHGIACLNLLDNTFRYFGPADGIQEWEHNGFSFYKSPRTGELFFGGIAGFNIFHPDSIGANPYKPPIYITALHRYITDGASIREVETANITNLKEISLPHDAGQLTFEFAALSFSNPQKNQYTYQLEGFNSQWIPLGTKREVTFVGLPHGNYTLRIKGSNGDGLWNETPAELRIKITPPWWRTWWAYLLYALAFGGSLWAYIQYRSRTLEKENKRLEGKVTERTNELEQSLKDLKSTQNQLIQKEKLASLGELTAGIAHEIQNPLNFVNNFSELSVDLAKELKEEVEKFDIPEKDKEYVGEILTDLTSNQEKINHHGKRASSIVKGMLEHSRTSTGERAMTDINALADEYLRLSYHGMRAKDKNFNADYNTDFDENLPKINIVPQDMGRVLLNLMNNAFYAVHERNLRGLKNLEGLKAYTPSVFVSTKQIVADANGNNQIVITVKDNGNGIPENIKAKIFQPFFTTKPTGQGTGLGLSLAYDIVTKGHAGTLEVVSSVANPDNGGEGVGSEFIIRLPTKVNEDLY